MANTPLEELIHRYESGERDPELIRQLNEAAWDGFHDPWERTILANPPSDGPSANLEYDPEAVQPFTWETIQRFLEIREFEYWKADWNAGMMFWSYSEKTDRTVRAIFAVEGKQNDIFKLRIVADRRVPAERFDRAFRLCNDWSNQYRWPRAYLEIPELKEQKDQLGGREPPSGLLVLDLQLLLSNGIHQTAFNDLVGNAISASWDFWLKAHDEYGL